MVDQQIMIQNIPRDRVNIPDFKTDLHFAETSSRPIKATLKGVKIDIFGQNNVPEERELD